MGGNTAAAEAAASNKQPATARRKSKLRKSNHRPSPKSVLETMTSSEGAAKSSAAPSAVSGTGTGRSTGPSAVADPDERTLSQITLGAKIAVYWPDDDQYYPGIVAARDPTRGRHVYTIRYDDGELETVDLAAERFRLPEGDGPAAVAAAVGRVKATLDELRRRSADDPGAARRIATILREDLGKRGDVTFHTLLKTGIGRTVALLTKHEDRAISQAAAPVLHRWKAIDARTPAKVKAEVKASMDAAGGGAAATDRGGAAAEAGAGASGTSTTPAATAVAPAKPGNDAAIDLTDSPLPPPRKVRRSGESQQRQKQPLTSEKRKTKAKAEANKVTPGSVTNAGEDKENEMSMSSAPSPPELASSSLQEDQVVVSTSKKPKTKPSVVGDRDEMTVAQAKLASAKQQKSDAKRAAKSSNASAATTSSDAASAKQANNAKPDAKQTSNVKSATSTTATVATSSPKPPKKKKRTFHDEILYTMLTSCKPYTLKTLAKDTNNTVEGLRHAMLSFLDKKLVICKEFPSKKGSTREPKKLYWANPMSLAEVENGKGKKGGGGGAVTKELSKLLAPSAEIEEARASRQQLERQRRALHERLTPLLAIPTMKELGDQIADEERKLNEVQDEIRAVKGRMADASQRSSNATPGRVRTASGGYASAACHPADRFRKLPRPKPQDPTTLKRKINHMLGEYKNRKRKCMDFVEELADAMEKKTKDVLGDRVLGLDTDEMEWGRYEDGTTGKVYGTKPKANGVRACLLGRKRGPGGSGGEDDEAAIVKIPAKYRDL